MASFVEILSYEFLRNAFLVGLLASVLCGVVGTFVVVKRLVFVSGSITHAAFGGLGACYFVGADPRLGAAAVAVLSALALARTGQGRERSRDAAIGILWAVGMALGVIFIHKTPGYAPNLMTYLFGNILTVDSTDVAMTMILVGAVLGLLAVFFKEIVAVAFDEVFAAVQGVPVRAVMTASLVVVALSVVFLIQLVGIILVIALLTIPPVIGLMLVRSFTAVMVVATLVGVVISLGGLALSYRLDLPSGPAIVVLGTLLLVTVYAARRLRRRGRLATNPGE